VTRPVLAALLLLSGCALWDQTTFQPSPEAEPPAPPGPPPPGPRVDPRDPLVIIDFATADPPYRDPLRYAIRAAEARRARVQYDVIALVYVRWRQPTRRAAAFPVAANPDTQASCTLDRFLPVSGPTPVSRPTRWMTSS
jgi:hypothetical protein